MGAVSVRITQNTYPPLPRRFAISPDVSTMWFRYGQYKKGKEPLLSMAYACLTLLEGTTGQKRGARQAVCQKYFIVQAVRDKLGELVSEKGNAQEARKLDFNATIQPLTDQERSWIVAVIKALIRRKAEYDADQSTPLQQITMSDFPPL
jgi:hypothetical protein